MLRNVGLAGGVLLVMIVPLLVMSLLWTDGADIERLPLPEPGQVSAELLSDGHPVWLVGHVDGSTSVLDAFSSHIPFGISKMTRWCKNGALIEDPFHGSRYNEYGDKVYGPAPSGLRAYPITEREGYVRVDGRARARPLTPELEHGEGLACLGSERALHDLGALPQVLSPAEAAEGDIVTWQRFHGSLWVRPATGVGLLCAWLKPDPDCAEVSLPHLQRHVPGPDDQFSTGLWINTDWLLRVEHGRITELALVVPADD